MDFSAWILSIVGIVLLAIIVDIILPEGQTNKYIKSIFAIVTVFVIVSPLPQVFGKRVDIGNLLQNEASSKVDTNFLQEINFVRAEGVKNTLIDIYDCNSMKNIDVFVSFYQEKQVFEIKKIEVNIKNAVITGDNKNINIKEKITKLTIDALDISYDKVIIYE